MTDKIKEATLQEMSDIGQEIQQTPDDLLRQSEREGWRYAKECEAEVRRLSVEQKILSLRLDIGGGFAKAVARFGSQVEFVSHELPSKPWVSLTEEEINEAAHHCVKSGQSVNAAIRAIEAALRSKNT